LGISAEFFADARAATARNQQGLLAELLEHQDNPSTGITRILDAAMLAMLYMVPYVV
jgi:predicted transcriptional regulator